MMALFDGNFTGSNPSETTSTISRARELEELCEIQPLLMLLIIHVLFLLLHVTMYALNKKSYKWSQHVYKSMIKPEKPTLCYHYRGSLIFVVLFLLEALLEQIFYT